MSVIVQKYGGTSVADIERIKNVASRVVEAKKAGNDVVVVVSALGDTTDELLKKAHAITPHPSEREIDVLLATGEQVSMSLLAMAIQALGQDAISFSGSQAGIVTDTSHTKARLVDIKTERIQKELKKGRIVIVAGFQGVTVDQDTTTLGRGGSDITAIALAAKLGAEACEIYTDVDGVYTANPRIVKDARRLGSISYEEMMEMAASGAEIMQVRAVEYGRTYDVPIQIRSSFTGAAGTIIKKENEMLERAIISGVTFDTGQAKVTIIGVPDRPGIAAKVFRAMAQANINVDMIIQNISESGFTDISFTVSEEDINKCRDVIERTTPELGARGFNFDKDIATVSLVGAGMRTHPGVAADMFSSLAAEHINIEMISTSPIKISCVIKKELAEKAVSLLHKKFKLGKTGR